MDNDTYQAAIIVDIPANQAQEWFQLISTAHGESGADWNKFREQFTSVASGQFSAATEEFLEYVQQHGGIELVDSLVADIDTLPDLYTQAKTQANGTDTAAATTTDKWARVVEQFGSGWANWDGSEAGWVQFRDWTYGAANSEDPALYAAAYEHLDPLNSAPLAGRISELTEQGFTIRATATTSTTAGESPWARVVEQFGSGWANWDGSEAGWVQFRDWTYGAANSEDPALYAAAYEHLDPLNSAPLAGRISELTEQGFTIRATATTSTATATPAAAAQAAAPADAPTGQTDGQTGTVTVAAIIEESLQATLKEIPGAENLSADELDQIRAEVAAELAEGQS